MATRLDVTPNRVRAARMFFQGKTEKEISEILGISANEVKAVVQDPKFRRIVREKYGVRTL